MKYQAHISNAICHHRAPGCYLPAAEEGEERRKSLVSLFLLSALLLFFLCSHILNFYPQDNYFFFTHKSNTEMFIPHSLTRTIKMIHFLHLCGFYFLTFIWLFVIRLQPVFGRFDNRTVNLSHGAQQSKKTILCLNACLCVPAPYHALTNTQWGSREVWNQFQYPSSNGESIRDRQ